MKSIQLVCLCLLSALASAPVRADDGHHEAPAAAAPAAGDSAVAAKEEANAKPAKKKPRRKKARATVEATPAAEQPADAQAEAPHDQAVPAADATVPASAAGTAKRVRVKDRAAAAAAVAASQADAPQADAHGSDAHAQEAKALDAQAADAPHAAPATELAVPQAIEPAKRARVKAPLPAAVLPAPHDDAHAADAAPAAVPAAAHDPAPPAAAAAAKPAAEPAEPQVAASECNPPFKSEIAALFERWNASLRSGDPKKVVAQYAPDSILLPTLSNRARFTAAEKEEYFVHFLQRRPEGKVDDRLIDVDCNSATDAGLYTFRFADGSKVQARYSFTYKKVDGQWLITSHHSSAMPEKPMGEDKAAQKATDNGTPGKGWVRFP